MPQALTRTSCGRALNIGLYPGWQLPRAPNCQPDRFSLPTLNRNRNGRGSREPLAGPPVRYPPPNLWRKPTPATLDLIRHRRRDKKNGQVARAHSSDRESAQTKQWDQRRKRDLVSKQLPFGVAICLLYTLRP
ncbi:hypothetical protein GCM10027430_07640 [Lysobacter tyrosinilyticus]